MYDAHTLLTSALSGGVRGHHRRLGGPAESVCTIWRIQKSLAPLGIGTRISNPHSHLIRDILLLCLETETV